MAFVRSGLTKVSGHANNLIGNTWEYFDATDAVATIAASGYFNNVTNLLRKGDVIVIRGSNGTALVQVTSNTAAATVTVGAFTALT